MNGSVAKGFKVALVVSLLSAATFLLSSRFRRFEVSGEEGAKVWFYDDSNKQLYPAPRDTLPPDSPRHPTGVRAVVVNVPRPQAGAPERRIAYLETYTAELKTRLEKVKAAYASGQPIQGPPPERSSPFFLTNDLVRRPGESLWHIISSPEGQKITSEWRSWRGPEGQMPSVSLP